jgi:hypothetical protein
VRSLPRIQRCGVALDILLQELASCIVSPVIHLLTTTMRSIGAASVQLEGGRSKPPSAAPEMHESLGGRCTANRMIVSGPCDVI